MQTKNKDKMIVEKKKCSKCKGVREIVRSFLRFGGYKEYYRYSYHKRGCKHNFN